MLFVTTIQHKWVLLCLDPQPELRAVGASSELTPPGRGTYTPPPRVPSAPAARAMGCARGAAVAVGDGGGSSKDVWASGPSLSSLTRECAARR